jgi:hypothetical protein
VHAQGLSEGVIVSKDKKVLIQKAYSSQISAYGSGDRTIIGPAGWLCISYNGTNNISILIYPKENDKNKQYQEFFGSIVNSNPSGQSTLFSYAATYFPDQVSNSLFQRWSESNSPRPPVRRFSHDKISRSGKILAFTTPPKVIGLGLELPLDQYDNSKEPPIISTFGFLGLSVSKGWPCLLDSFSLRLRNAYKKQNRDIEDFARSEMNDDIRSACTQ